MTDQLEAKREEEHANRVESANICARMLSTLMLGERINTGDESYALAVPGGWIFYETHKAGITSTFVPQPPQKQPTLAQKMVLP